MSDPLTTALGFTYSTLTGDTTYMSYVTSEWTGLAPAETEPDYGIIIPQSMQKVLSATGQLIMTHVLLQAKVVGPFTDYTNLSAAYARMITLLGLVRTTSGSYGQILACYQTQDLYLQETVAGVQWVNLGGLFRVEV